MNGKSLREHLGLTAGFKSQQGAGRGLSGASTGFIAAGRGCKVAGNGTDKGLDRVTKRLTKGAGKPHRGLGRGPS